VVEVIVSSWRPPVHTVHDISPVASPAGEGGSNCHAHDPSFITVGPARRRKGYGGRH